MVGDRIKTLRVFQNMTQEELVDGIASIAYLSKVENGLTPPSEQFLIQIAKKLDIEASLLLDPKFFPNTEEQIKKIFNGYWKSKILADCDITLIKLFSSELQNNRISLQVFSVLIRFFYSNSRLPEALEAFNLSKKVVRIENSSIDKESIYFYLYACGVLHFELYEFHKANDYFLKTENYIPDDDKEKARLYYNLSLVNEKINPDKTICLYYSEKAANFMKKAGDINRTVNILLVRSLQFFALHHAEKALECAKEAQELYTDNNNDPRLKSSIIYSFGKIYQMNGDFENAIEYFKEYLSIVEHIHPEKIIKGYKRLAEVYIHLKEWDTANKYLELSQSLSSKYKKIFFDKEVKLLEIYTYKVKQQYDKYEKELQKLLDYCNTNADYELSRLIALELGSYYHERQAYKKASSFLMKAYAIEKEQSKNQSSILQGYKFEY